MTIGNRVLVNEINARLANTSFSTSEALHLAAAICLLNSSTKYSVANSTFFPAAANNTGRVIYDCSKYNYAYSNGVSWLYFQGPILAIIENNNLSTWGSNDYGQLGDGTTINRSSPVSVVGFTDWCQVSSKGVNRAAIRTNGTLWTWGSNFYGTLGDNQLVSRSSPVSVVGGFTDWCRVSTSTTQTAAIRTNGTLWIWGRNGWGSLGNNTVIGTSSPVSVIGGFTDWCRVEVSGSDGVAAIRTNGTLWTWGKNDFGNLGDGTTICRSSPVSVVGAFTDWCQVSAGGSSSAAIRTNGTLWTWGCNGFGQLGDGTTINRSSPVSVAGGFTDWCQVSTGSSHTAAIRTNGTLWTWGGGFWGNMGNNTTISQSSPVSVVGGFTDWCGVSIEANDTTAIRTNGTIWSWGINSFGDLGDNTTIVRSSPVSIVIDSSYNGWYSISSSSGIFIKKYGV